MKITDTRMTSDKTTHSASLVDAERGLWRLSWLPGRIVTRNQAITGMTLAESLKHDLRPQDSRWQVLDQWASELGLTGANAVVLASAPADLGTDAGEAEQ